MDSQKLPGRLNSTDEHSQLPDLKNIFKKQKHTICQPESSTSVHLKINFNGMLIYSRKCEYQAYHMSVYSNCRN